MYYQCKFCNKKRNLNITDQEVQEQVTQQFSNGLANFVDIHRCSNNDLVANSLSIDPNMAVREQTLLIQNSVSNQIQQSIIKYNTFNIPIASPIKKVTPKFLQIRSCTSNINCPYIKYHDSVNSITIEINQPTTTEFKIQENGITVIASDSFLSLEKALYALSTINQIIEQIDPEIVLLQLLYILEFYEKNESWNAYNDEFLLYLASLKVMSVRLIRTDAKEVFFAFGEGIFTTQQLYEKAVDIVKKLTTTATTISTILNTIEINYLDFITILIQLKNNNLLEISYQLKV